LTQEEFKRFDMEKKPITPPFLLLLLKWIISRFNILRHHSKITKINMKGLRPPYLLLCNHNAFYDFSVETCALFPHRGNYVAAIDGYIGREWLLRLIGCICKRKFTKDIGIIRHLHTVIKKGNVAVLFPEARYSLCGTTAVLPDSLGKLVKFLKVPVVVLIMNGHHINAPFWNIKDKGIRTDATMKQIFTADEIDKASFEEINERINKENRDNRENRDNCN
jgi:1-acyl-sn-glycerol-3-phosphate acyltransferase